MSATGLAVSLAVVALSGYALALRRLLRGERPAVYAALAALTVLAAWLRLVHTGDYPPFLSEDETKSLAHGMNLLRDGKPLQIFDIGEIILPITPSVVFKATLVPLLGPTRWAMRSYSLLCSLLAVPAAFAVGRALRLRVAPSLALAAFVATLTWAIFYGRVDLGASMVFHQLLLLAALARLIWGRGGWPEVAIGGFALAMLLYDYHPGRMLFGMPLVAAVLATGRRRLLCLVIPVIAIVGFWPHVVATSYAPFAYYQRHEGLDLETQLDQLDILRTRLDNHLRAYVTPGNTTAPVLSIRTGSWHPLLVIVLAILGSMYTPRFALFVWAGFVATLLPSLLSGSEIPSSRRLLATYPFIAIAAAAALDRIGHHRLRRIAVAVVAVVAGWQGIQMFFSDETWTPDVYQHPETQITAVLESLPDESAALPILLTSDFWQHAKPLAAAGRRIEYLSADDWSFPSHGAVLGFGPYWRPLHDFARDLLGADAVVDFGRAFRLEIAPGDWSWLQEYGWTYVSRCAGAAREARLPTLFHEYLAFDGLCASGVVEHRWFGRWNGPATHLRLRNWGVPAVRIDAATGYRELVGDPHQALNVLEWTAQPGDRIEVETTTPAPGIQPRIGLFFAAATEADVLPPWKIVAPLSSSACELDDAQSLTAKNASAASVEPAT